MNWKPSGLRRERQEYQKNWYEQHKEDQQKRAREYTVTHREQISQLKKAYARRLKKTVLDHYGHKCNCCGESVFEFLGVDHIEGNGAAHRREINRHGGTSFYKWMIDNEFPDGFQVLCHNCNFSEGHYGYCPHQEVL